MIWCIFLVIKVDFTELKMTRKKNEVNEERRNQLTIRAQKSMGFFLKKMNLDIGNLEIRRIL